MKSYFIYIIIALALLSIIGGVLIARKMRFKPFSPSAINLQDVFDKLTAVYGSEVAQNVEKIYRLETANFTSNIYKETGGAGMLEFTGYYPYGWTSLTSFWNQFSGYRPTGIYNSSNGYGYLKFSGSGGFFTLAEFLIMNGNNAGRWNSTNESQQTAYNEAINNINTTYC